MFWVTTENSSSCLVISDSFPHPIPLLRNGNAPLNKRPPRNTGLLAAVWRRGAGIENTALFFPPLCSFVYHSYILNQLQ